MRSERSGGRRKRRVPPPSCTQHAHMHARMRRSGCGGCAVALCRRWLAAVSAFERVCGRGTMCFFWRPASKQRCLLLGVGFLTCGFLPCATPTYGNDDVACMGWPVIRRAAQRIASASASPPRTSESILGFSDRGAHGLSRSGRQPGFWAPLPRLPPGRCWRVSDGCFFRCSCRPSATTPAAAARMQVAGVWFMAFILLHRCADGAFVCALHGLPRPRRDCGQTVGRRSCAVRPCHVSGWQYNMRVCVLACAWPLHVGLLVGAEPWVASRHACVACTVHCSCKQTRVRGTTRLSL